MSKKKNPTKSARATDKELEYLELLKRSQAEFQNYRKQVEESRRTLRTLAHRDLVMKLFPILDYFKKALEHVPETARHEPWVVGIEHLERQFEQVLNEEGLTKIETVGKEFNPELHDAVMTAESDRDNVILEELEAGYRLGEVIVKPAKVKVGTTPKTETKGA